MLRGKRCRCLRTIDFLLTTGVRNRATTTVAEATQLYLRYDGEIGFGTDSHAVDLGVRFSW